MATKTLSSTCFSTLTFLLLFLVNTTSQNLVSQIKLSACEELRCDGTVGPGGSPDENGETTIDALVMDGVTMEVGAVAAMRYVKDGIKAARLVMQHTEHTLLVGEQALVFAISMGLPGPTNLSSSESMEKWIKWKENHCQPNFWKDVVPKGGCGPYHAKDFIGLYDETCSNTIPGGNIRSSSHIGLHNHDTISMAVIDKVAKKTAQKSKTILSDIERWQKGVASTDVFGVPIEVTVQRQQSSRPIPHILVNCADYLILSDSNASIPEGVSSIDVAALVKCYLATLPEPLTTLELYNEIRGARSSINAMRNMLKRLPTVNYTTLEFITALLLRVSQKSVLNKMDTQSLAMEMAPVTIWQKGRAPDLYKKYWNQPSKGLSNKNSDPEPTYIAWDMLSDEGDTVDDFIPLDDGVPIDMGAIEVVQCLMEHHNAIFTDANETVWR